MVNPTKINFGYTKLILLVQIFCDSRFEIKATNGI